MPKGNSEQQRGSVMCHYFMTIEFDLRSDETFVQYHALNAYHKALQPGPINIIILFLSIYS